jgi:hypothetical protein
MDAKEKSIAKKLKETMGVLEAALRKDEDYKKVIYEIENKLQTLSQSNKRGHGLLEDSELAFYKLIKKDLDLDSFV